MSTRRTLLLAGIVCLKTVACDPTKDPAPLNPPPARSSDVPEPVARAYGEGDGVIAGRMRQVANRPAIDAIAAARCAHQLKCGNIGQGKEYATEQDCSTKLSEDKYDDLAREECPGGIVREELDECLAEIKNQNCDNVADSIERLAACRESDLCRRSRAETRPARSVARREGPASGVFDDATRDGPAGAARRLNANVSALVNDDSAAQQAHGIPGLHIARRPRKIREAER